ncbi:hypothetical protein TNCV_3206261 [Trichonephila clavipes]|nr:hypothetical protein TNCV_3206261 [Trichonephila clavipes]
MSSRNVKPSKSQLRTCNATQIRRPNTEKNDVKLTKNVKELETPGSYNYQLKRKRSNSSQISSQNNKEQLSVSSGVNLIKNTRNIRSHCVGSQQLTNINSISNPNARQKIAKTSTMQTNEKPTSSEVPATLANNYSVCSDLRLSKITLNVNSVKKNSVYSSDLEINSIPVNDYKNCKAENISFQKIKKCSAESKTKTIPETKVLKVSSKRKSIVKSGNELYNSELEFHKNDTNTSKKRKLKSTTANHQNCGEKSQPVHKKMRNKDVFVSAGTLNHKSSCQDILDVEHNKVPVCGYKVENINNLHEPSSSLDNIEKSVYESASQSFVSNSRKDTERTPTIDNQNEGSLNSVVIQLPLEDMENVTNEHATNSSHQNTFEISNVNSSMPEPLLRCNIVHNCILEMINAASYNQNSSDDSIYSCNSKCGPNCKVCLQVTDTLPSVETFKSGEDSYGYLTELESSETTILSKPVKERDTSYDFHMDQSLDEKLATSTSSSLQYVDGIEKKRTHINDETSVGREIVPDSFGKPPTLNFMLLKNKIDKVNLLEEVVKTEPASLSDTKSSYTIKTCVETKIENSFMDEKCPDINLFERYENFGPAPRIYIPSFNNAFNIKENEKDKMPILTPEQPLSDHNDGKKLDWKDAMDFLSEDDVLIEFGLNSEIKCIKCSKSFQTIKECCCHFKVCTAKTDRVLNKSVSYACCICYNIFTSLCKHYFHKFACYFINKIHNLHENTNNVKPKINPSDRSVSEVKSELNQNLNPVFINLKNIYNNSLKAEYSTCQKHISHSDCSFMHHNEVPVDKKDNLISQDCSTNVNYASCSNEELLIEPEWGTEPPSNYIKADNGVTNIGLQNNFASTSAILKNTCIETNLHPPQTDNLASSTNEVSSMKQEAEPPSNYINADNIVPSIDVQNIFASIDAMLKNAFDEFNWHPSQTDNLASSTNEVLSIKQEAESSSNYINADNGVPNISLQNSTSETEYNLVRNGHLNKISSDSFSNFCNASLPESNKICFFPRNCKFCNYPLPVEFSHFSVRKGGKVIFPSDILSFSLSCRICKEKHTLDKNTVKALFKKVTRTVQLKILQNEGADIKKEPIINVENPASSADTNGGNPSIAFVGSIQDFGNQ